MRIVYCALVFLWSLAAVLSFFDDWPLLIAAGAGICNGVAAVHISRVLWWHA